jgi:5-methylcytosine-specific restriction endonuclease McrA
MAKKTSQPGSIHLRIVEVMKRFPQGISGGQIRQELQEKGVSSEDLRHLGRRIAELDEWFVIERVNVTQLAQGQEPRPAAEERQISIEMRAQVLYAAHGRCQICGRTIKTHKITLVVEPREPLGRGGADQCEGFWAICEACDARTNAVPHPAAIAGARPRIEGCRRSVTTRENHEP